jgi:hypothetical protein
MIAMSSQMFAQLVNQPLLQVSLLTAAEWYQR